MLFGDAATATWMGEDAAWQLGKSLFGSDGSGAEHLRTTNGKFFMNGRQVYNFALVKVPAHLKQLLEASHLQAEDIDLYCLHQEARRLSMPFLSVSRKASIGPGLSRIWSRLVIPSRRASRCCWKNTCSPRRASVLPLVVLVWGCHGVRQSSSAATEHLRALVKNAAIFWAAF